MAMTDNQSVYGKRKTGKTRENDKVYSETHWNILKSYAFIDGFSAWVVKTDGVQQKDLSDQSTETWRFDQSDSLEVPIPYIFGLNFREYPHKI